MKILLDTQIFNQQKFGGISRYHTEIFLALSTINDVEIRCPIIYSDNLHLKEAKLFQSFKNVIIESKLFPKFLNKKILKKYKKANKKEDIKLINQSNFDVFIPSYYDNYFLDFIHKKPFVLSVYDMIHELFPQYFVKDLYTAKNKKILIEKATRIIAISESTKQDILKVYPHIDSSKIDVVYLSHSIKKNEFTNVMLPNEYILFVGNRTLYKNFLFFIKAVAPILKNNPMLFIVCAGGNKFNREENELIRELNIENQLIQQNFEDNELSTYYKKAKCFVFPSEYEGFGIPVLESMACGCPIVLANHSSFPEVAGEAGVYFELNNANDLRNKIENLLQNENLRISYIEKGLLQEKKFSWKKTAEDCLKVYQKAILNDK